MHLNIIAVCATALCLLAWPSHAESVQSVVDPRPTHHVLDLTGTLSPDDVAEIDAAARRSASAGELFVVVVRSTDGAVPRQWTTALFARLALDTRARNRGVILMAALSDRKAEIVVGDGYPDEVTRITDAIMSDVVVANFKAGSPRDALVQGARAIEQRVIKVAMAPADDAGDHIDPGVDVPFTAPFLSRFPTDPNNPAVWLGGAAGLGGVGLGVREIVRRRPRKCAACHVPMMRLGEEEDDAHLKAGERAEESLGSVDYDIWSCPSCGEVLKTRWGAIFSRYSRCPGCTWRTMRSTSRTLISATEHSTGLAEVTEDCTHCPHHRVYTRMIPRVSRSSSSSSGGGSSSGRGSSGSW